MTEINWEGLEKLSERLSQPGLGGGMVLVEDLRVIDDTLDVLIAHEDYEGIIKLRGLFTAVIARDSIGVHGSFQRLTDIAIHAAEVTGNIKEQAHLLGANGHNLHRQGFHQRALNNFHQASQLYEQAGESFESLKNYFMMSLCYRALGNISEAKRILQVVIAQKDPVDSWYGNPLNVLGWIERDEQHLETAEAMFRQALALHRRSFDSDILAAGTLADLGEVLGLLRKNQEAKSCFEESLLLIHKYDGQYDRQEARTETKWAELLIREGEYTEALNRLNRADDLISFGSYKDQLWKIELLRAMIKFRQGKFGSGLRHLRSAKAIYDELRLPFQELITHTLNRIKSGSGLFGIRLRRRYDLQKGENNG